MNGRRHAPHNPPPPILPVAATLYILTISIIYEKITVHVCIGTLTYTATVSHESIL